MFDKIKNFFVRLYRNFINRLEMWLGLSPTSWDNDKIEIGGMKVEKCIDISKHQTKFNAAACKQAGVTTVICRLAYGSGEDRCLNAHAGGVITGGMKLGGYGFGTWHYSSQAGSYAVAKELMHLQVNKWISLAKEYGLKSWLAIDQELEQGEIMWLSKEDNTTLLNEAAEMIENAGFAPCLYASASWIMERVDLTKFKYPLWVAYYKWYGKEIDFDSVTEQFPANSGTYGKWMNQVKNQICMWQFTSEGYADKYGCTHGNNAVDKNWLYFQPNESHDTTVNIPEVKYFEKYTGGGYSIAGALASIGEQNSYDYREKVAEANHIDNYKGTPEQNTHMLNLLKEGKLIKP